MTEKKQYYKHPKYGHVYGEDIRTPTGRAAWPALVEPKEPPPPQPGQAKGAPRYECTLLLPKLDIDVIAFKALMQKMVDGMLARYNEGQKAKLSELTLFADGDSFDLEKYPYYAGNYIMVARNAEKPRVANTARPKPQLIADSAVQGGNKVRFVVTPLITAKGVSYKLLLVQYVEDDGTKFAGARPDPMRLLDEIPGDDVTDEAAAVEAAKEVTVGEALDQAIEPKKGKQNALNLL